MELLTLSAFTMTTLEKNLKLIFVFCVSQSVSQHSSSGSDSQCVSQYSSRGSSLGLGLKFNQKPVGSFFQKV